MAQFQSRQFRRNMSPGTRGNGGHRRRPSSLLFKMLLLIIAFTVLSLFIGFKTISSVANSSPSSYSDNDNSLYISKSGQLSSQTEDTGAHDPHLNKLRPSPDTLHDGDGDGDGDGLRQKAIEAAKKQTRQFLNREGRLQRLRDVEKEEYLQKIAEEEKTKKAKEAELEAEQMEMKYYMYYEDSNDEKSTVVGMAYSNDLVTYQRFVGSLRGTGFGGIIILGVEDVSAEVMKYLIEQNVIVKTVQPTECSFQTAKDKEKCYLPYPHIKREWAHFPLARDWLSSCVSCTGPVVFASADDTFFQKNPFGSGMPVVKRLHLYEQHPSVDVAKTSAGVLLKACLDIDLAAEMEKESMEIYPMRGILSASTALGTRDDIIDYLGSVYSIFRQWMQRPECHFQHSSSDAGMAVVNFLRIKERMPYRTRIMIHRTGILNNAEFEGKNAVDAHVHLWNFRGLTKDEALRVPFEGAKGSNWIDEEYMVTDKDGDFIDVFLQKSAIVYGYHSFGLAFLATLDGKMKIRSEHFNVISNNVSMSMKGGTKEIKAAQLDIGKIPPTKPDTAADYLLDQNMTVSAKEKDEKPKRKQKIVKTAEVPEDKKKSIDGMYYESPGKDSDSMEKVKVRQDNPAVPVQETREKEAKDKNIILDDIDADDTTSLADFQPGVMTEPVDKKFEITETAPRRR